MTTLTVDDLQVGMKYVIFHKTDRQNKVRASLMTFMGVDGTSSRPTLLFDARPDFGTQRIHAHEVRGIDPATSGEKHYMNKTGDPCQVLWDRMMANEGREPNHDLRNIAGDMASFCVQVHRIIGDTDDSGEHDAAAIAALKDLCSQNTHLRG